MELSTQFIHELYAENIFEFCNAIRKCLNNKDKISIARIARFLREQTEMTFNTTHMDKLLYERPGNNFNYYSQFLLTTVPAENKIDTITITNVPNENQIHFPSHIKPTTFCIINSELGNLLICAENITTLSLRKIPTNQYITSMIVLCEKLQNLHIESNCANEIKYKDLMHMQLLTFKISGKYTSKLFPIDGLQTFLKSQAQSLIKLSIKIKNRPDIAYKLNFKAISFTDLKKLKFYTCTNFINRILTFPTNTVESLKINSNLLTYTNLFSLLNQIENYEMLKIIKFTSAEYGFPINTRCQLIANTFKGQTEIKFKQKI